MKKFLFAIPVLALLAACGQTVTPRETGMAMPALTVANNSAFAGPSLAAQAGFMIAYCQYHMKKDASGKVIYQHPDCGGDGPVFVGSTTKDPYVPR